MRCYKRAHVPSRVTALHSAAESINYSRKAFISSQSVLQCSVNVPPDRPGAFNNCPPNTPRHMKRHVKRENEWKLDRRGLDVVYGLTQTPAHRQLLDLYNSAGIGSERAWLSVIVKNLLLFFFRRGRREKNRRTSGRTRLARQKTAEPRDLTAVYEERYLRPSSSEEAGVGCSTNGLLVPFSPRYYRARSRALGLCDVSRFPV